MVARRELVLWGAGACLAVFVGLERYGGPILGEDSYQYLSAAANLTDGHGLRTSILHYDVDRSTGTLPAPLTMWPVGYPVAIGSLHVLGVPLEAAAVLISALAFVALVPLFGAVARPLGLTPFATRLALLWLLANSWSAAFPAAAVSESLFTALIVGAVALCLRSDAIADSRAWPLLVAGVLLGLAYWVRFAGLLVLAGILTYFAVAAIVRRDRTSLRRLALIGLPAALLIGAHAIRSLMLTGSWAGGHEKAASSTLPEVLKGLVASVHHLFFGSAATTQIGVAEVTVIGGLLALGAAFVQAIRRPRQDGDFDVLLALGLLASVIAVYSAGLIYIGTSVAVTFDTRLFYPLLPVLILAMAAVFTIIERRVMAPGIRRQLRVAALAVTAAYVLINGRSLAVAAGPLPHEAAAARLAAVRPWIDANVPGDATIVASDGQATAYALHRPAVSLTHAALSDTMWTEQAVRDVMTTYHAGILILYPRADLEQNPVQAESAFLTAVLEGRLPDWLELASDSATARIYRRR